MPLTAETKESIRTRVQADPEFREAVENEAMKCLNNGDHVTGEALLRECVVARCSGE